MASLIPDTSYTPNTTGASNAYVAAQSRFSESLMDPITFLAKMNSDAIAAKELEEEKAIRAEDRAWKLEDRKTAQDEINRTIAKETATNEALKAILNPKAYPQEKIDAVLGNADVDQSKLLSFKKNAYDIAANTPGTPEYNEKVAAERAEKLWELNAQIDKQMKLEGYKNSISNSKDKKDISGLLAVLQTPKTKEVTTVKDNNQGFIDAINKVNSAYEKKAEIYGNTLNNLLENDKTLNTFNTNISLLTKQINEEKSKNSNNPNISTLEKNKLGLETSRDRLITSLDSQAKRKAGLSDDWYKNIREVPAFEEETVTENKPLSKDEWINTAIGNVGSNISNTSLSAILKRADSLYPELDSNEKLKLIEKQDTANDIKKTIKAITGKEATSNTLGGLKEELSIISKVKPKDSQYGAGPLSLSTMLKLGIDDEDITAIRNKASSVKIKDEDLEKMIVDINSTGVFPTSSGAVKDTTTKLLDMLEPIKK